MLWTFCSTAQTRARLSFKRRPPTRQHRRSTGEDATLSPCELDKPQENGDEDQVFDSPAEGGERGGLSANPEEAEGRDCDSTEGEGATGDSSGDLQEERKAEAAPSLETLPEEEQTSECGPAEPAGGADVTEEGQEKEEEHWKGNAQIFAVNVYLLKNIYRERNIYK